MLSELPSKDEGEKKGGILIPHASKVDARSRRVIYAEVRGAAYSREATAHWDIIVQVMGREGADDGGTPYAGLGIFFS